MEKLKHYRFPTEIIFLCVRWYLRYNLSYRDLVELMTERNIDVSYESIRLWVLKFASHFDDVRRKRQPYYTLSWRVDETYIKIKGKQYYYYRAIDSHGHIIDFYLSPHRDAVGAEVFLRKAIATAGSEPFTIVSDMDKAYPKAKKIVCSKTVHRRKKYMNNPIERDHQRVKKRLRTMRGLKSPDTGRIVLEGIEGVYELYRQGLKGKMLNENVYQTVIAA